MEPVSSSAIAGSIVSILARKGVEKIGEQVGAAGWAALSGSIDALRNWLNRIKPELKNHVDSVVEQPANQAAQSQLVRALEEAMKAEPGFAESLRSIAASPPTSPEMVNQFTQAVGNVTNGKVTNIQIARDNTGGINIQY